MAVTPPPGRRPAGSPGRIQRLKVVRAVAVVVVGVGLVITRSLMKRLSVVAERDSKSLDELLSCIVAELSDGTPTDDIALIGLKWLR